MDRQETSFWTPANIIVVRWLTADDVCRLIDDVKEHRQTTELKKRNLVVVQLKTRTPLVALLKYVVVHHDVVPPELHLVLHVCKQTSHLCGEVDDVSWLIFVKDSRRRGWISEVAILFQCAVGVR